MRPRLHALVAEQLRTVQRQIAECQLLERQLAQVLQRLQTAAPAHHADGCRCLDSDTLEEPELISTPLPLAIERRSNAYLDSGTLNDASPLIIV